MIGYNWRMDGYIEGVSPLPWAVWRLVYPSSVASYWLFRHSPIYRHMATVVYPKCYNELIPHDGLDLSFLLRHLKNGGIFYYPKATVCKGLI